MTWWALWGQWKLRGGSPGVRVSQKKLKPSDGREAELGLKKGLSKEQHRTSLRVLLSYFSSHLPSTEMSLLDPNPAAHSESQRHMVRAASPN